LRVKWKVLLKVARSFLYYHGYFMEIPFYSDLTEKKMKLILLLPLTALLISCKQKDDPGVEKRRQDSIKYVRESIAFIRETGGKEFQGAAFILADKPFSFQYYDCLTEVIADSSTFTKEEIEFIRQKNYPSRGKILVSNIRHPIPRNMKIRGFPRACKQFQFLILS
jgi:hypothetical protein